MIRQTIFVLSAILTVSTALAQDGVRAASPSPVLVELFTSQGCSSCPPADRVLAGIAQRPGVLALSFHVTYWDDLGWKDPFGAPINTDRQKAYRLTFHNAQIYTPQMVIGGVKELVGQDAREVTTAIDDVARRRQTGPGLVLRRTSQLNVTIDAAQNTSAATIWIAAYLPRAETPVGRGENSGKTLVSTNIVRKLVALGPYAGAAVAYTAPPDFARENEGVAAWVQANSTGAILSAADAPPQAR